MPQDPRDDGVTLPVVEETAVVDKHKAVTGKVRLRTVSHAEETVVDEPLLAEEVTIERVAVDRWVDGPVPVRQDGDTTIVPLVEEVAVVEKRLKLTEEVRITKRQVTRHAPQPITLRRQEAVVERLPPSLTDQAGTGSAPGTGMVE